MNWREVQAKFPSEIVLIEALRIEKNVDVRKIQEMAVISTFKDSSEAWREYKKLHHENPHREMYIFHTDRQNIDVIEQQPWKRKYQFKKIFFSNSGNYK